MKKYIVVSTSNNSDYFFYAPFIEKAWNSYGWDLCVMITSGVDVADLKLKNPNSVVVRMADIPGLREQTIAQASRLYAANFLPEDALIMTSDMDLLPLSNYWNPSVEDVTVYGYDLTWRSFYPMGYIAMSGYNWKKYMNLTGNTEAELLRDAKDETIPHSPLSNDWEQWWNFDWSLITQRLKPFEKDIKFIDRGQVQIAGATLARGRVDRYNWQATLEGNPTLIDAHCENNNVQHPVKLEPFLKLFESIHGKL